MYSVDFEDIEKLQHQAKWEQATEFMIDVARRIEKAGADFVVICTNTMHKMAEDITKSIQIPLLHIADVTAEEIKEKGLKKVGLLGTRFTMEEDFYKGRLYKKHGIDVFIPDEEEKYIIHNIVYDELCLGEIKKISQDKFATVIEHLVQQGAEGIILGCTEIPLLVRQEEYDIPLFDTTKIHAKAAVRYALGEFEING